MVHSGRRAALLLCAFLLARAATAVMPQSERDALTQIADYMTPTKPAGWNTDDTELDACEWTGIACDSAGSVTSM
jgi:hypothetical protein